MKKIIFLIPIFFASSLLSQDSLSVNKINAKWVEPEIVFYDKKEEIKEEPIVESIKKDLEFLESLPKTYDNVRKDDLKNILKEIDNKLSRLTAERDSLLKSKIIDTELVETKEKTITTLNKEKNTINLTLESDELKDLNGNLVVDKNNLTVERETYKKYLYWSLGILSLLGLGIVVLLQRKTIKVQDGEIEKQLEDIGKKNTYLEHAARIIRHDMHSGINTYIPRGITSLEKRITPDELKNLKIELPIKMIKDGLAHTQKVYKSVYEFTNLVKQNVVLEKKVVNIKDVLLDYLSNTSYLSQVNISELVELEINEILFSTAIDNLIKNGLKYNNNEDKFVNIYIEEDNLIIQDNGVGLTQKQFEKIIKPKKIEKKEEGLGLSISYVILKEHGFEMTCDKNNIGTKIIIKIK